MPSPLSTTALCCGTRSWRNCLSWWLLFEGLLFFVDWRVVIFIIFVSFGGYYCYYSLFFGKINNNNNIIVITITIFIVIIIVIARKRRCFVLCYIPKEVLFHIFHTDNTLSTQTPGGGGGVHVEFVPLVPPTHAPTDIHPPSSAV